MIRRPPRSTLSSSSAASDVYKRQSVSHHLRAFCGPRSDSRRPHVREDRHTTVVPIGSSDVTHDWSRAYLLLIAPDYHGVTISATPCRISALLQVPNHALRSLMAELAGTSTPLAKPTRNGVSPPVRQLEALTLANQRLRERLSEQDKLLRQSEVACRQLREQLREQNELVNELVLAPSACQAQSRHEEGPVTSGADSPVTQTRANEGLSAVREQLGLIKGDLSGLLSVWGSQTGGSKESKTDRNVAEHASRVNERLLLLDLIVQLGHLPSAREVRVFKTAMYFGERVLVGTDLEVYQRLMRERNADSCC
eukprot:TRINITY_DN1343_c0_g1_i3.p1 TRINITY_DN1343_c0_g1~~TRINITY_DN1343_c0_g1_i3.p1  ORF type:complete len:310 (+),score=30.51 TRINITY_DN1343_c0_g1_i3:126-1055(+)